MAKLNPGSVAAIVQAGIVVLVLGAGSLHGQQPIEPRRGIRGQQHERA